MEQTKKQIVVRDREAGNVIDVVETIEEGKKMIEEFEHEDKENGCFTEDFYEVAEIEAKETDTIRFLNLDVSLMQANETNSEAELRERIESEFSEDAIRVGEHFRGMLEEVLAKCTNHTYLGRMVESVERSIGRFAYIKDYDAHHDIEIDLLLHEFRMVSHL